MIDPSQKLPLQNDQNNVVDAETSDKDDSKVLNNASNPDSVNPSSVNIPKNLTEKLHDFEDAPREEDPIYISEVVERTQKASNAATESTNSNGDLNEVDPSLELDSGLDAFLDQLNITRKQFYSFMLVFLILLFGVGVSFYFLFKYFSGSAEEVKVVGQVEVVETTDSSIKANESSFIDKIQNMNPFKKDSADELEVVEKDPVKTDATEDKVDTAENPDSEKTPAKDEAEVKNPTDLANQIANPPVLGVKVNSLTGAKKIAQTTVQENRLSYYLRTYRKVRNIYNTDLFSYLSQVPNRNKGFEAFLVQFKGSLEESRLAYESLREEIAQYEGRVKKLQEDAAAIETAFFDSLDGLESEVIAERLKAFQDISQKKDIANAELKARQAIAEKYTKAIPLIESKIKAIEVNKDPFVKGVQVVDYEQIDLDLIITK
jgi:hypothetical protein